MGWEGRQLKSAGKNGTNLSFTYDSEGIRTSKTVGSTTTKYLLNGTQILAQTTNGKTLSFFYDQQGNRVGMADSSNNFYYYIYNLQGDVIALADADTGKLVVTYTYDAWGKLVELKDNTANSIGTQNPFRYRGYYYDTETGLYYLQTRYYDPEVGRFINADAFASTDISGVLSANMFAYCENNPVMRHDPDGEDWQNAFAIGLAVTAIGVIALATLPFSGPLLAAVGATAAAVSTAANVTAITGLTIMGGSLIQAATEGSSCPQYKGDKTYSNEKNERIEYEYYGNGNGNVHYEHGRKKTPIWKLENGTEFKFDIPKNIDKIINSTPRMKVAIKKAIDIVKSLANFKCGVWQR